MTKSLTKAYPTIRVGVGGWTYEPWRGVFYPKGLPQARELEYAAQHLTSIEVNGTFYRTQTPATFRKWASDAPDGFVFSLKGPRYAVNRRVLAEAGDSIKRFLDSGITELGPHLGPLLWQFAPHKKFDAADFGAFLDLLPKTFDGHSLRHVVEVRNDSFKVPEFIAMARRAGVAICYAEHESYSEIGDITADFVMRVCKKAPRKSRTATHPKRSTPGPNAPRPGPKAASRPICRASTRSARRKNRAMSLFISSTKPNCARPRRRWL